MRLWSTVGPLGFIFVGTLVGLLAWLSPMWFGGVPMDDAMGWMTGGGGLLGAMVGFAVAAKVVGAMHAGQPISRSDQNMVVDGSGVDATVGSVRTVVPWAVVERVVETRGHVFLYFARYVAIIVPKRAFSDADEGARFLAFVKGRLPGDTVVEAFR